MLSVEAAELAVNRACHVHVMRMSCLPSKIRVQVSIYGSRGRLCQERKLLDWPLGPLVQHGLKERLAIEESSRHGSLRSNATHLNVSLVIPIESIASALAGRANQNKPSRKITSI